MHLLRARGDDGNLADDLKAWGIDDESASAMLDQARDTTFEVDAENWPAVVLFLRCQTQWRVAGMGQRIGLDYAGVALVAKFSGAELDADLFGRVQTLEVATVNELNRRALNGKANS